MVKKKSRIEINREILSRVMKEMERPRLTASVREEMAAAAALAARVLAVHPTKA
jgi:hypothetical protein